MMAPRRPKGGSAHFTLLKASSSCAEERVCAGCGARDTWFEFPTQRSPVPLPAAPSPLHILRWPAWHHRACCVAPLTAARDDCNKRTPPAWSFGRCMRAPAALVGPLGAPAWRKGWGGIANPTQGALISVASESAPFPASGCPFLVVGAALAGPSSVAAGGTAPRGVRHTCTAPLLTRSAPLLQIPHPAMYAHPVASRAYGAGYATGRGPLAAHSHAALGALALAAPGLPSRECLALTLASVATCFPVTEACPPWPRRPVRGALGRRHGLPKHGHAPGLGRKANTGAPLPARQRTPPAPIPSHPAWQGRRPPELCPRTRPGQPPHPRPTTHLRA